MFDINEYLKSNRQQCGRNCYSPLIYCQDGFSISVQANFNSYCFPRNNDGPWETVECGFPSDISEDLIPYAEDPEILTETAYSRVPVEIVNKLIDLHGGILMKGPERNMTKEEQEIMDAFLSMFDAVKPILENVEEDTDEIF